MNLHKVLRRQLEKNLLSAEMQPDSTEAWINFLANVNQFYLEADQERYLQERSMQISSREVMALNERLEKAQQIAELGYWSYDAQNQRMIWSKEVYSLFHFDKRKAAPSLSEFLDMIHEADRYEFEQQFEKALGQKINFEQIIRIKINEEYYWFQIVAQCNKNDNIISGIFMNIHDIKLAEEEINQLNQRLILTARQAGMSEVAATVLHNIGNTLNTLNVSLDMLKNNSCYKYLDKLIKINEMLLEHQDDLKDFMKNDPKGQLISNYLQGIKQVSREVETTTEKELSNLELHLQHIKDIVASQKTISGLPNMIHEKVYIPTLIEEVLNIVFISCKDKIIIEKRFAPCPPIETDKSKLVDILINLIQNGRDAVLENCEVDPKQITIQIDLLKADFITVTVRDNGIGIDKDNLNRIFVFGFTTKKTGHGFGLHSVALSAKQMGGSISVESDGLGRGASFILDLPLHELGKTESLR